MVHMVQVGKTIAALASYNKLLSLQPAALYVDESFVPFIVFGVAYPVLTSGYLDHHAYKYMTYLITLCRLSLHTLARVVQVVYTRT